MKNIFIKQLLILLISLPAFNVNSQNIQVTAGSVNNCAGSIVVPVSVSDLSGVAAISLVIDFDSTVLVYTGYQNLNSALGSGLNIINGTKNRFIFSWTNTSAVSISNDILVEILFTTDGGTSDLNWDLATSGNCEFSNISGNYLSADYFNGLVNAPGQVAIINSEPLDKTGIAGTSASFSLSYSGATILQWQESTDNGSTWNDLADDGYYEGTNWGTLTIYSPEISKNGFQYRCILEGGCPPPDTTRAAILTVIPVPPTVTVTAHNVNSCEGEIAVPVTVNDFTGIGAFSLTMDFDTSKLDYIDFRNLANEINPGDLIINSIKNKIYISWAKLAPATISPNDTLLELLFYTNGQYSEINWNTAGSNCEFADEHGNPLDDVYVNSTISSPGNPPNIYNQPGQLAIHNGENGSFQISASYAYTYQWQLSTDGGNTWENIVDNAMYSGATSSALSMTNVNLLMNNYKYRCYAGGACPPADTSGVAVLGVGPQPQVIITTIAATNACNADFSVPVIAQDFNGVSSVSLVINYDSSIVDYTGYSNLNPLMQTGMVVSNSTGNQITFGWVSVTPVNIGHDTIFNIDLHSFGGTSTLSFDLVTPGNCEYNNVNAGIILGNYNSGTINVDTTQVQVSITGLNSSYCLNASAVSLTGTPGGGVFSGPGIAGSMFNPMAAGPGNHEVVYTYHNGWGCEFSSTKSVKVFTLPVVTLGENKSFCEKDTASITIGDFYNSYNWSTGQTNTNKISVTTNSEIFVEITDTIGCSASSDTVIYSFNPSPAVNLGLDQDICNGDTVSINAGDFTTYLWNDLSTGSELKVSVAGTYTVMVSDSIGCNSSDSVNIILHEYPVLGISVTEAGCGQASGQATVTATGGSGSYSYLWDTDPQQTSPTATGMAAGIYHVTTDDGFCPAIKEAIINEMVVPDITLTANNDTICSGESVLLTASGAESFTWLPVATLSSDTGSVVTTSPTETTTYLVNGVTSGCLKTAQVTITVISYSIVNLGTDIVACEGDSVTLTGPDIAESYYWNSGENGKNKTVTNSGTYWLRTTNFICQSSDTIDVTFNPVPLIDLGNNLDACEGESVVLHAGIADNYLWNTGSTADSLEVFISDQYFVSITKNSCTNQDTVNILFHEKPQLTITTSQTQCGLPTGSAVVTVTAGTGNYTYLWNSVPVQTTDTAYNLGIGSYEVLVSDDYCSNSATAIINEANGPAITLAVEDSVICEGGSTIVVASGADNYNWIPTESITNISADTVSLAPQITTNYTVTGEKDGCSSIKGFTITVIPILIADAGEDQTICTGSPAILIATGGNNYLWNNGEINDTISVNPLATSTYYITTSNEACTSSDSVKVFVNPLPADAGVISGTATVCQGQNAVTYTVPSIADATSYVWTLPTGATGTSTSNSISVDFGTSAVSGDITVKGENPCGNGVVSTLAITVNPSTGTTVFTAGATTVCQDAVDETYTATAANSTSIAYSVLPVEAGVINSTTGMMNWDPAFFGTARITATATGSCGTTNAEREVLVNPSTLATSFVIAYADICQDDVDWTYTAVAGYSTSITYSVVPVEAGIINPVTGVMNWDAAFSGILTITAVANGQCGTTSADTVVTVNPSIGTTSFTSGATMVCQDAIDETYTATAANSTAIAYSVLPAAAGEINATTGVIYWYADFTGTATITAGANNQCGITFADRVVTVNPTTEATGFTAGATTVCQDASDETYTATAANSISITYTVLPSEVGVIDSITGVMNWNAAFSGTATITATSTGLCGTTTADRVATVNPLPDSPGTISGPTNLCNGQNDVMYNVPDIPNATTYVWTTPAGANGSSITNSITVDFGTAVSGNISVKGTNSCGNGAISTLPLTVNEKPATPVISINGYILHSETVTGNQWYYQNSLISGAVNQDYTVTANGDYYVIVTLSGCSSETSNIITAFSFCDAQFSYTLNGLASFTSNSIGATDYFWTFGDGSSSTLENPNHQYSTSGYYKVTLTVRNSINDCIDDYTQSIQVGKLDCRADFTFAIDQGLNTVNFTDNSTGVIDYFYWDFGDGSFSVEQSPDKTYNEAGIYTVVQTVFDNTNSCIDFMSESVQVGEVDCSADFICYIDSASHTAYFTNRILGEATATFWSFGDGQFSTMENPVHEFTGEGIYSVGLNTYDFNTGCMDYYEEILLLGSLGNDCEADFVYLVNPANSEVTFSNISFGDIVSSIWNFGDESVNSTESDPVHPFANTGYFNVCLTVTNASGIKNMSCKWVLVEGTAANDCRANFMFSIDSAKRDVKFVDNSFGNITKYSWDFGDNKADSISDVANPAHTYNQKGYYLVQLKAEDTVSGCVSNEYKLLNVADAQVLKAAFGYEARVPDKKFAGYPVDMVSASSGDGATVEWDFGDKQIKKGFKYVMDSTSRIVTHYYANPGKYDVCLRISDPVSKQSDEYCSFVYTKNNVGVNEPSKTGLDLHVYPNPFIDFTTINYTLPNTQYIELAVFDQLGRRIETLIKARKDSGTYQLVWESKTLTTGIYYLKLISSGGIITKQLIISR